MNNEETVQSLNRKVESLTDELLFCYDELDFIFESGNILSTFATGECHNWKSLSGTFLDIAVDVFEVDMGWVYFVGEKKGSIEIEETRGIIKSEAQKISQDYSPDSFEEIVMVNHSFHFDSDKGTDNVSSNIIMAPFKSNERYFGAIVLGRKGDNGFLACHVNLLTHFSKYSSHVFENARMLQEIKSAYQLSENANKQLQKLNEMKNKIIFISSHELKTPITICSTSLEVLKEFVGKDKETPEFEIIEALETGLSRMKRTVNNICQLSLFEKEQIYVNKGNYFLAELVDGILIDIDFIFRERNLRSCISIRPDLKIYGDVDMIKNAITELILNAVKHSPDGNNVEITAFKKDNGTEVKIGDSGSCIAPEEREHIFERFYKIGDIMRHTSGTYEYKSGGLSIGLAITKNIIEAHGGKIWVECSPKEMKYAKGSCFSFFIPEKRDEVQFRTIEIDLHK